MIASVQTFGLGSLGGGARILRALLEDAPVDVMSVCTSIGEPPPTDVAPEVQVPPRRDLGRVDSTRLRPYIDLLATFRAQGFTRRLATSLQPAQAVHIVAQDGTFVSAVEASRRVGAPFFLSLHDDIEYADPVWARSRRGRALLSRAWQEASWRFAIGTELGEEYCRRYGTAPYSIVTDGLATVPDRPRAAGNACAMYFMGLLHLAYEPNFLALVEALEFLGRGVPQRDVSLVCRCGSLPTPSLRERAAHSPAAISVAPFVSEAALEADLERADMLYLPLPFDRKDEALVRLSLPTKLITYLGSGLPIVYHGPPYGNAYELLSKASAAFCVTSLDPQAVARALSAPPEERQAVAASALDLARSRFLLETQRLTFWSAFGFDGSAQP